MFGLTKPLKLRLPPELFEKVRANPRIHIKRNLRSFAKKSLSGSEHPVSRISEAGYDVAMFIQLLIQSPGKNGYIGMSFLHSGDPFGSRQKTQHSQVIRPLLLVIILSLFPLLLPLRSASLADAHQTTPPE